MAINLSDVAALAEIAKLPAPECECGGCNGEGFGNLFVGQVLRYNCIGCNRSTPWCIGSDGWFSNGDSNFAYCNDCFVAIESFLSEAVTPSA